MKLEENTCKISRWQLLKACLTNLKPEDFLESYQAKPGAVLIDVRTPEEFEAEHLEGAININYLGPEFWDQIETLDPEGHYFVYCRTERRSIRACTLMKNGGFNHIINMEGGITAWKAIAS